MSETTFEPWYRLLELPIGARTPEERALAAFARKCRVERIRANIAASPSVSLFASQERAA